MRDTAYTKMAKEGAKKGAAGYRLFLCRDSLMLFNDYVALQNSQPGNAFYKRKENTVEKR